MGFKFNPITGQLDLVGSNAGTGTVTTVTSSDGSLDITNPTTTPDVLLHLPIDTGGATMGSGGFGILSFKTASVERLRLENNGDVVVAPGGSGTLTVNGPITATGNISAANYPPTDTANTLARFNNSGVLDDSNWSIDNDTAALTNIASTSTNLTDYWQIRAQTNLNGDVTGTARTIWGSLNQGGTDFGAVQLLQMDVNANTTGNEVLASFSDAGGANVGDTAWGIIANLGCNTTNNKYGIEIDTSNTTGANYYGLFVNDNGSTITGEQNLAFLNSSATVGGNFRFLNTNMTGSVAGFASGVTIIDSSIITKGYTAFGAYHTGNIGDGSGVSAIVLDSNINSSTINGGLTVVNFSSNATVDGNFNIINAVLNGTSTQGGQVVSFNNSTDFSSHNLYGFNLQNSGPGESIYGIVINNTAAMTQEMRPININNSGANRTITAIDMVLSGNTTDDATAIRINMGSVTSTNQEPQGIQLNMPAQVRTDSHVNGYSQSNGTFHVQGEYRPLNGAFVDVGNNLSITGTVSSPLTGTDSIIQLLQSNLIVSDDISTGPIGLDTNMLGLVSQIQVDSGKTAPLIRSALIGTSVPSGSGGTITEHVVLEILGLPSFGGSVTNPTRIGIQDSQLLGQNFSDNATDAWGIRMRDPNLWNHLARLSLNTSNYKNAANTRLHINDGHIKVAQTNNPTVTLDANAGTGATGSVTNATDTAGIVELDTGTLPSSGIQITVNFDQAYNVAPIVVITPQNSAASTAQTVEQAYVTSTTTGFAINFNVASAGSITYTWFYTVIETH